MRAANNRLTGLEEQIVDRAMMELLSRLNKAEMDYVNIVPKFPPVFDFGDKPINMGEAFDVMRQVIMEHSEERVASKAIRDHLNLVEKASRDSEEETPV